MDRSRCDNPGSDSSPGRFGSTGGADWILDITVIVRDSRTSKAEATRAVCQHALPLTSPRFPNDNLSGATDVERFSRFDDDATSSPGMTSLLDESTEAFGGQFKLTFPFGVTRAPRETGFEQTSRSHGIQSRRSLSV